MDKVLTGGVVVALVLSGLAFFSAPSDVVTERVIERVGGSTNQPTERHFFKGGLTDGGGCYSTSTSGTLAVGIFENYNCITAAAAGAGQAVISWTTPTASQLRSVIPSAGDCAAYTIDALGLAAATTTTIVAGTSVDLVGLDATGAGTGADVIDGAEIARLTLCRQSDDGVTGFIEEWIAAD